jgi:hypothetical protein
MSAKESQSDCALAPRFKAMLDRTAGNGDGTASRTPSVLRTLSPRRRRYRPSDRGSACAKIAVRLAEQGYVGVSGRPFETMSVRSMLRG